MMSLKHARDEMINFVAKSRLRTAISRRVPAAADNGIYLGFLVLFYREKPNRWEEPYLVVAGDRKKLCLNVNGDLKEVGVDKVKKYNIADVPEDDEVASGEIIPVQRPIARQLNDIDHIFDQIISGEVFLSHVRDLLSFFRDSTEGDSQVMDTPSPIMITERFQINDGRKLSPEFQNAKRTEISGLKSRGTWRAVHIREVPRNANIIGGRFVCEIKNFGTDKEKSKAR